MEMLKPNATAVAFDECSEYTCTALELDEDQRVIALAADLRVEQQRVAAAAEGVKAGHRARTRQMARIRVMRERINKLVTTLNLSLLLRSNNNRKAQLYLDFLPNGLTGFRRLKEDEFLPSTQWIIDALIRLGQDPLAAEYLARLQTLTQNYRDSLQDAERAEYDLDILRAAERAAMGMWRVVCRRIYGALLMIFADDKARAESYFKKMNGRKPTKRAVSDETTGSGPAAADGN